MRKTLRLVPVLALTLALGNSTFAMGAQSPTAEQDHQDMMNQLGIKTLRLAPSGDPKAPNQANYDESKANPFPDWPDVLTFKNGRKVDTPAEWQQRRAEIMEDFEPRGSGSRSRQCSQNHLADIVHRS